ncbi:MAG: 30S ribosomal protein S9 [Planctomycetes bacterium]|nr:30S ribosomal protein S9 [Planctomycetota bacterium]MBI3833934.1 30S ribosomal protein S9 [Planctomycetota bacterium]
MLTPQRPFHWGTGRRKSSVARVRIKPGTGKFLINDREVDDFFRLPKDRNAVRNPLQVVEAASSFDVFVNVHGGGISGQAGAVVLGLSRALIEADVAYESKLKGQDLLTRDSREVERKKYGRSGARKRFQFSKR